jgi:M6 family metalloprotease-like protein
MGQGTARRAAGWRTAFVGILALISAAPASAQVVLGQLELRWGDAQLAHGQVQQPERFTATLVTDDGKRHPLDPAQARRAAGDLYALANRRVAVEFATSSRKASTRGVNVIVPADRLSQPGAKIGTDGRLQINDAVLGNTRWMTLMCKFSDIASEQKPLSFFQSQYGTAPGQLGHYWNEVSYGKVTLTGSTARGWFTLPSPRASYVTMVDGEEQADLDRLFADCTAAADPTVDFASVQGINMMFNGELDGFAWGGGGCTTLDGVQACKSATWNPPWAFDNLAPLAHEMGHGYGLPHSDNSDGDDDPYDNPWDVMSDIWSNATYSTTFGTLPKHINAFQRERLGWIDAARKLTVAASNTQLRRIQLDRASLRGSANVQMIVLAMPQAGDPSQTVIYTIETRARSGDYEAQLAGNAVIIHKVQDYGMAYSQDADVPPADVANNEGSMFKVGETWRTPDNRHWVHVESVNANGFVITVGPRPMSTGGNLPALRVP